MKRILLLAQRGPYGNAVYNFLAQKYSIEIAIMEPKLRTSELLRRRIRRLGWSRTAGQLVFMGGVVPFLTWSSRPRIESLMRDFGLDTSRIPPTKQVAVSSVNSPEALSELRLRAADIVILAGTRVLQKETLVAAGEAAIVNIHAGITPLYRGVHGGYWALACNDLQHCGVAVHLVDAGIDTGAILAQHAISPTPEDNFTTYPWLQAGVGLRLLRDEALPRLLAGDRTIKAPPPGESRLWSHPTAWEYWRNRALAGVK